MNSHSKVWFTATVVVLLATAAVVYAQEAGVGWRGLLTDAQRREVGLDRLDQAEIDHLFRATGGLWVASFVDESATAYMRNQGWRQIRVLGAVEGEDLLDELWLVVWDNYETYLLDPFSTTELPEPGIYWARSSLSSWKLLDRDGNEVSYTAREPR